MKNRTSDSVISSGSFTLHHIKWTWLKSVQVFTFIGNEFQTLDIYSPKRGLNSINPAMNLMSFYLSFRVFTVQQFDNGHCSYSVARTLLDERN
jgi:hypothetical protein